MTGHGQYQRLGGTLDDAAGEAFDKVARLLGLPYPGGPSLERSAHEGNPTAYKFPRAWLEGTWDFSFSGLKTAVLYEVKKTRYGTPLTPEIEPPDPALVPHLAASFQAALVDVLVGKTVMAAKQFAVTEIFVAGGVSANQALKAEFQARSPTPVRAPPLILCTDNAAMIAAAANFRYLAGQRDALDIDALPNWRLT
jgi:N6-L-threonylcarbamoyladenine synthase